MGQFQEQCVRMVTELQHEHERLEELLVRLHDDSASIEPRRLQRTWTELELCLRRHLQVEERQLLPLFVDSSPGEVMSILTEQRHIRELMGELGVAVDLHLLDKEAVLRLVGLLRKHAEAEDRNLYAWLERSDGPMNAGL